MEKVMNKLKLGKLIILPMLVTTASAAFSDDNKMFIGSFCSFADNPLASHSKMHHRFKNTSGRSQWVTCPVVRDRDGVEWLGIDTVGTTNYVRFEQRAPQNGSLSGWNAYGAIYTGGSGRQHYWFNGSSWANGVDNGYYAIEMYLGNNAYINGYRVAEK
jgi:hypothetical protein